MNKGAALARGEWHLFLQGDDWLPEGTIEAYRRAIADNPEAEMICGNCEAVRESDGTWTQVWSVNNLGSKKLTVGNIALGEPMINARLIRRNLFWRLGGFSLEYSLASDRDFLLRASEAAGIQHEVDAMTYRYRWHSGSSTMTEGNTLTAKLSRENLAIAKAHLSKTSTCSRAALLKWHERLAIQVAMNALEEYRWRDLLQAFKAGVSENPGWIIWFGAEIMCSLPGFFLRGGKSRTQLLREGGII
jgi:GT2 family glycosyltransferase